MKGRTCTRNYNRPTLKSEYVYSDTYVDSAIHFNQNKSGYSIFTASTVCDMIELEKHRIALCSHLRNLHNAEKYCMHMVVEAES